MFGKAFVLRFILYKQNYAILIKFAKHIEKYENANKSQFNKCVFFIVYFNHII